MGRPRSLNKQQVQELVAEAKRGIPKVRVAQHFGVSTETVQRIVSGRSYSDLSGIQPSEHDAATCVECREEDARDRNLTRARTALNDFECLSCHQERPMSVATVLKAGGRARCSQCERRGK